MIVARIYVPPRTFIEGSSELANWNYKEGWYPIEGFEYSIEDKGPEGGGSTPAGSQPASKGAARGGGGPQTPSNGKKGGDKPEGAQMTFSKNVDYSTVYSMKQVMDGRKGRKGVDDKAKLWADIHVLSSVDVEQKKHIFASLMIHLEGVQLKGWTITGTEDDRPKESIKLTYDRACLYYQWTPDGTIFMGIGPRGWDQTANEEWSDYEFDKKYKVSV